MKRFSYTHTHTHSILLYVSFILHLYYLLTCVHPFHISLLLIFPCLLVLCLTLENLVGVQNISPSQDSLFLSSRKEASSQPLFRLLTKLPVKNLSSRFHRTTFVQASRVGMSNRFRRSFPRNVLWRIVFLTYFLWSFWSAKESF